MPSEAAGRQQVDEGEQRTLPEEEVTVASAEPTSSTESGRDVGRETGELYGEGIAPTGDIDEDGVRGTQDFDGEGGETWTEALRTSTTEHGTAGEAPIDAEKRDDDDEDRPPADLGAGGPAGL